jgi:aryl-alcohol dehydrogenase-like predicted oxidoreductase
VDYRALGDSDLRVSEIALGTWATFGESVADDVALTIVDTAFDVGINFFDTGNILGVPAGRAEEVLGRALAGRPRSSFVVATKLFFEMPNGDRGLSREQVLKQIDDSLARLRLDHVDLYQCHRYDENVALEETMDALDEIVRAGKVRWIGFSEWLPGQIEASLELSRRNGWARFVSSQTQYSLLRRDAEPEVIPLCAASGISQIVWSPLAQGVLTGKYRPGEPFAEGTRAAGPGERFMSEFLTGDVLERVQRIRPIADELGLTMAQLALAWILREPNVASAIVGASRPEHVRDNATASGLGLDEATLQAIEAVLA